MSLSVGIDWGEDHYDVAVMDRDGTVLAIRQIDTGLEGFTTILRLIGEHGGSPEITPVGIETDKNLIVTSLRRAGFTVYPLNPRAVGRYRERHVQSGRKSDHQDAVLITDVLRVDRHT